MTERRYTVDEIDRMRKAIWGDVTFTKSWSTCFDETRFWMDLRDAQAKYAAGVEDKLRTYMTAGVAPEELEAHFNQKLASPPR